MQRLADAVSRVDLHRPTAPDDLIRAALGDREPADDVAPLMFHIAATL